jgi:hypothetical protein
MNGKRICLIDSLVENIWISGFENHAVASYNGYGPFKIVNNYLEASGITLLFGGTNPKIEGFVPTDIEMRRNHFTMRSSWNPFDAAYDSTTRPIKNRVEFKYGQRALVEGNVIEKSPVGGQNGEAFVIKSMAGEAGLVAAWYITQNIYSRHNLCQDLWNCMYITGVQMAHLETLGGTDRILFENNLFANYANTGYGSTDNAHFAFWGDATNVQFKNNTAIPKASSITLFNPRSLMWMPDLANGGTPGWRSSNCIWHAGGFDSGTRWAFTNVSTDGIDELVRVTGGDYLLENSFLIDGPSGVWAGGEMTLTASIAAMNFTSDNPLLGLDSDSPAKNAGTDGNDAGVNYTKLNLATSGVV